MAQKTITIKFRVAPEHVEKWRRAAVVEKEQLSWSERDWHSGNGELSSFIRRHAHAAAEKLLAAADVATRPQRRGHKPRSRNVATRRIKRSGGSR